MISLVIHGGAWTIPDGEVEAHRKGCETALRIGWKILSSNGTAIEAVEEALRSMEDCGTFDAGSGSHLNAIGQIELDASIMSGKTMRCGAVAAVHRIKNPISLARKIMDESEHIFLVGEGAEQFAQEQGMQLYQQKDLICPRERERWDSNKDMPGYTTKDAFRKRTFASDTIGIVALDNNGDICAGTSTGGTFKKHPGRVGDSPLIGCGSYADNEVGGVSTTGWGEAMIKVVMAKTVMDIMEANGGQPQMAAQKGIEILKRKADGDGGVIVMNAHGQFGIAYNTPRMARAYMNAEMREPVIAI